MDSISTVSKTFVQPLQALYIKVAEFAPNMLAAILMLVVGYIFAKIAAFLLSNLLKRVGMNKLSEKVGISEALENSGVKKDFSTLLGAVVFWMIMLTFVVSASDSLGLDRVSSTIDDFILYLPKVVAAAVVLLIGLFVSNFVRNGIKAGTSGMNAQYGNVLSRAAYGLLVVISIVLSISQLDIDVTLLNRIIQIALLSVAVSVMLSMGLGTREISSNVMSGIYLRDQYKPGAKIQFGDISGTVEQVGSTKTSIKSKEGIHSIPNQQLMSAVVTIES